MSVCTLANLNVLLSSHHLINPMGNFILRLQNCTWCHILSTFLGRLSLIPRPFSNTNGLGMKETRAVLKYFPLKSILNNGELEIHMLANCTLFCNKTNALCCENVILFSCEVLVLPLCMEIHALLILEWKTRACLWWWWSESKLSRSRQWWSCFEHCPTSLNLNTGKSELSTNCEAASWHRPEIGVWNWWHCLIWQTCELVHRISIVWHSTD